VNQQVFLTICSLSAFVALMSVVSIAAESATPELRFENHHYVPQTLTVPAGQPVTIKVINASKETIEFESFKLNREKAVEPGEVISVHLPALSPGTYNFYDDFHQDVPQGSIVAK
jgi:hypothetical protein